MKNQISRKEKINNIKALVTGMATIKDFEAMRFFVWDQIDKRTSIWEGLDVDGKSVVFNDDELTAWIEKHKDRNFHIIKLVSQIENEPIVDPETNEVFE